MIAYHVDMFGKLRPGMELNRSVQWSTSQCSADLISQAARLLHPDGVMCFGARFLTQSQTADQRNMQTFDLALELIRALHFPDIPSRLTCLFAARSPSKCLEWIETIRTSSERTCAPCVYEVSCERVFAADASALDFSNKPNADFGFPASMLVSALRYWESLYPLGIDGPYRTFPYLKEELLLVPPVQVLRVV